MSDIINTITQAITPYLPTLLLLGEEARKELIKKGTDLSWDKAVEIWQKLHPSIEHDTDLAYATKNLAKRQQEIEGSPNDVAKKQSLETYLIVFKDSLQQVLDKDPILFEQLNSFAHEITQRQVAEDDSEITGSDQTAKASANSLQEQVASNNSKISNSTQRIN